MILFSKKAVRLVPLYLIYMIAILCVILLYVLHSSWGADVTTQVFSDKVYCYLLVPPFVLAISLIDESIKKPSLIRMKSRSQVLFRLLFQQYLFAILYLTAWFLLTAIFVYWGDGIIPATALFSKYILYLFSLFLFVNLSELLKRVNVKALSTLPFIAAYLFLIVDEQAITSITGRNGIAIKLLFSWTFSPFGYVMLPIFIVVTFILLLRFNCKYDIF